jgi:glycine cleavage system aminomethyltransferase T
VSRVTSGGYGYVVGESVAFAYMPPTLATIGTQVGIEVDGERGPAAVSRDPRYDPSNSSIKGLDST